MNRIFSVAVVAAIVFAPIGRAQDEDQPLYKTSYRVINVHRHCDHPREDALKAELEVMDRVGVRTIVNLLMDGGWSDGYLPAWAKLRDQYRERLLVFGYINWGKLKQKDFFEQLVREVEFQHRLGAQGIKVWKDLGMYFKDADGKQLKIDDPRLDPFWAKCGELGLPILIHTADPKEYWYPRTFNSQHYGMNDRPRHYDNPNMPKWEDLIQQRDNVLKKHPKTTFIGAHFGSETLDLQKLAETFDRYPNFNVDCAARLRILGRLNPPAVRDFFTKYQDRILFGTDSDFDKKFASDEEKKQWQNKAARFYSRYLEYFETDRLDIVEPYATSKDWLRLPGAKLPPSVLEKFYHANAERLIPGLTDKKN
jgi:predicted TIM-barrel fold metal-dependent hydrolase